MLWSVEMTDLSRRNFLKLVSQIFLTASSILGLGSLFRFLGHPTEVASPTALDIGSASDYPPGSRTILPEVPAILAHTDSGFTALSLTCTHLGCTVKHKESGFSCACHGSHFGANGEVLHGPAANPLPELRVELTADNRIILHTQSRYF
jgi:Rieske Fe-S protein